MLGSIFSVWEIKSSYRYRLEDFFVFRPLGPYDCLEKSKIVRTGEFLLHRNFRGDLVLVHECLSPVSL